MNPLVVWNLIKKFLPTKKISAWILGVIAAILAGFVGLSNQELKDAFCTAPVVQLPESPALKVDPTPTK